MKTFPCRQCGKPIMSVRLESGREVYLDPEPHENGKVWLGNPDGIGRVVGKSRPDTVATDLYRGHVNYCRGKFER